MKLLSGMKPISSLVVTMAHKWTHKTQKCDENPPESGLSELLKGQEEIIRTFSFHVEVEAVTRRI